MHAISTASLLSLGLLAAAPAEPRTTPEQARQTAQRSLAFLKTEGEEWILRRQCHSCHHVGFLVWSLHEAKRHGLDVPQAPLRESADWAVRYGTYRGVFYQLNTSTFAALQNAGLKPEKRKALQQIKKKFSTVRDFRDALSNELSAQELRTHENGILKTAAQPGQGGGGEDGGNRMGPGTVASELLLAGAPQLTTDPEGDVKALVDRLVRTQRKDGSWKHGGQFEAFNRPSQESTAVVTAWNVLALPSSGPAGQQAEPARQKALAFLAKTRPGVSTESFAVHTLLAARQKDAGKQKDLLDQLRRQQLGDGGWAWRVGNTQSDAFATGVVLYTLGELGRKTDPAVARAWGFLARTQRKDGDWLVRSDALRKKPKASTEPIFSYWGTGWAAVGILRTLPQ